MGDEKNEKKNSASEHVWTSFFSKVVVSSVACYLVNESSDQNISKNLNLI